MAIKILQVKDGQPSDFSKQVALECLMSEISILAECEHKNVVKVKTASFDGTIVTERVSMAQAQMEE